jgi:hypothetical protein
VHTYQGGDPANYPQASVGFDFDAVDEALAARERPEPTVAEVLVQVIAFILDSDNYRLAVDVIVAASGLALIQGVSYTDLAKTHGISKQAFDKHILKYQRDFRLPVTRAQKSPQARESYRKTQLDRAVRLRQVNEQTRQKQQNERKESVWQSSSKKAPKVQLAH